MVAAQKHWARDLSAEERKVIEKLLGRPLSDEAGVEIRTVAPAEVPEQDSDQRRKLDELRRARLAIAEHTSHLTESADRKRRWDRLEAACDQLAQAAVHLSDDELDVLLGDRPAERRPEADARRL